MLLKSERVLHKNGELGYKTENTHKSLMTHNCHLVVTNDNRLVEIAIWSIIQFNPSSFGCLFVSPLISQTAISVKLGLRSFFVREVTSIDS